MGMYISNISISLLSSLCPAPPRWSASTPFCNWTNVNCDYTSSYITSIDLNSASVSGYLPPDLNQLFHLKSLAVKKNSLSGTLPSFENMTSLEQMYLDENDFTFVPNNFLLGLPNLQTFSISENNNLGPWQIPSYLAESTNLVTFYASNASITRIAWLHANMFLGGIPDISRCTSLFNLQLRDNRFTGEVPPSLMILPNLVSTTLQNNKLQGPFPEFPIGAKVDIGTTNSFCLNRSGPCDPQVSTLLDVAADLGYPMSLAESCQGNNACADWRFISCDSQGRNVTVVNMASALTSLAQLQIVDLSSNNLSGPLLVFPYTVRFIYGGNLLLGRNETSGGAGRSIRPKGLPSGSSSGSRKGGCVLVSYKCYVKRRHKIFGRVEGSEQQNELVKQSGANGYGGVPSELQSQSSGDHSKIPNFEGGNVTISIQVLRQVTNNFSEENVLGIGGFGVVYKGELHDGTKIVVKRMESGVMGTKRLNEFQAEIVVLTKVRHKHLVALLGYCINGNERLLVYEYMPEGTLSQHLSEWQEHGCQPLTWKQRVTIALDVASGVEYIHGLAQQSFIHRDLKPTNILLVDDMRAKVADFGLVKNAPNGKYFFETQLVGTFGYLAPATEG
ncbi:hypothetical protein OROMI_006198 [Orobanche minor]